MMLAILFACVSISQAEVSAEKRKEIEKMLQLTGMEKLMGQMKSQMLAGFQSQMPDVPKEFWDKAGKKMDMRGLLEKIIPIYDKYYTLEDLKAVNAFYETPAGRKIIATLPQVMQESMKVGQEWGHKIAEELEAEAKIY